MFWATKARAITDRFEHLRLDRGYASMPAPSKASYSSHAQLLRKWLRRSCHRFLLWLSCGQHFGSNRTLVPSGNSTAMLSEIDPFPRTLRLPLRRFLPHFIASIQVHRVEEKLYFTLDPN